MKNTKHITITSIVIKLIGLIALILITVSVSAKGSGKFLRYQQITDKEILVESTKGVKMLFSAYENDRIGVICHRNNENLALISPKKIINQDSLNGSIYVEELDELMQITSTNMNGLTIKIDKRHFEFTVIDQHNNTRLTINEETIGNRLILEEPAYPMADGNDKPEVAGYPRL